MKVPLDSYFKNKERSKIDNARSCGLAVLAVLGMYR
jgi:hypothetical protein